jgi:hypothetical protein
MIDGADVPNESSLHASQFEGSPLHIASSFFFGGEEAAGSSVHIDFGLFWARRNLRGTAAVEYGGVGYTAEVVVATIVDRPMMGDWLDPFELAFALHAQKLADVHSPQPSPTGPPKSTPPRRSDSGDGVGKMTGLTSSSMSSIARHKHSSSLVQTPQAVPPGVGDGSCSAMALTARCSAANGAEGVCCGGATVAAGSRC